MDAYSKWSVKDDSRLFDAMKSKLLSLYKFYNSVPEFCVRCRYDIHGFVSQFRKKMVRVFGKSKVEDIDKDYDCPSGLKEEPIECDLFSGVIVDSAELTSSRMSNEQIAYEILIDQYFQFVHDNCSAPHNNLRIL